jgi:imidazolonepropionase-like amidohydrolase
MTRRLQIAVAAAALAAAVAGGLHAQQQPAAVKAFTGVRLIDGTNRPPIANATIVVRGGRIVAADASPAVTVPAGAERVVLTGKTVVPGFIDTHVHLGDANVDRGLQTYAAYGVTTVFMQGGEGAKVFAARDSQNTLLSLNRARVFTAGPALAPTSPENARDLVAKNDAMKVDLIKIRVDDEAGGFAAAPALAAGGKMPPEVYRAVIDEAHKRGLMAVVHIFYLKDAEGVLQAGADFLMHNVRDKDVSPALITLLKSRRVCVGPGLVREVLNFVYESTPDFFSDPFFFAHADMAVVAQMKDPKQQEAMRTSAGARVAKASLPLSTRNLKKLVDGGVTIAVATDTGGGSRFPGYSAHMEFDLMAKAGMTPRQILMAGTSDAARCLKIDKELGTLEPGKFADFVVLDADPLVSIGNTRKISEVYISGNKVPR